MAVTPEVSDPEILRLVEVGRSHLNKIAKGSATLRPVAYEAGMTFGQVLETIVGNAIDSEVSKANIPRTEAVRKTLSRPDVSMLYQMAGLPEAELPVSDAIAALQKKFADLSPEASAEWYGVLASVARLVAT